MMEPQPAEEYNGARLFRPLIQVEKLGKFGGLLFFLNSRQVDKRWSVLV